MVEQAEQGDLVAALQEMKQQGKVRWIGFSSTEPHLETYIGWGVFDVFQIPYSALERQHEDAIRRAADAGAGVIVRGGVARGEPGAGLGNDDRWAAWEKAEAGRTAGGGRNPDGVPAALHQQPPRDVHQHRRHQEPGAPRRERRRRRARTARRRHYAEAKRRLSAGG